MSLRAATPVASRLQPARAILAAIVARLRPAPAAVTLIRRLFGLPGQTRYADFLPEAQALAERDPAPLARALGIALCLAFAAIFAWTALSTVEQVARAPAVVRPVGKVKIVNHPEGGTVAAIDVKEGDHVHAGQPLVVLDDEEAREEVAKRTAEWQGLAAEAARLAAEATATSPHFPAALAHDRPDLVQSQMTLFESRRDALVVRRSAADQVVRQREGEVAARTARLKQMSNSLTLLQEQENAIAGLADKGYFPRLRYLSVKRELSDLVGKIAETRKNTAVSAAALAEARDRRRAVDEDWRSQVLDRLSTVRVDAEKAYSQLQQDRARLRDRVVRAPADGIVQQLTIAATGQSIAPNETMMQIVPDDSGVVIEARVANDDIGYIHPGQHATIKVKTYDYVRFGTLSGIVERVAADAVKDERTGALSFPVMIRADHPWLGEGKRRLALTPGMQVDVDLLIGHRSILSYLTERLSRARRSAFTER